MRTYDRRILFVISAQHLIPHGGIGQFAKGFVEMAGRLNWKVDICLDTIPKGSAFIASLEAAGVGFVTPRSPLSYGTHRSAFAFCEAPLFEMMANFRMAIMEAHATNLYDLIVCNTTEAMPAAYALSLQAYVPVVFYTHHRTMVFRETQAHAPSIFTDECNAFFNRVLEVPGVIVGTQAARNATELKGYGVDARALSFPMTEQSLLALNTSPRRGVLFIGRWEENKNPAEFVRMIAATKLPAKVLANKSGCDKFRKAFADLGITDVEYGEGLTGEAKAAFIRSAAVFYNPSLQESYSIATYEALSQMPVVALAGVEWPENFTGADIVRVYAGDDADRSVRGLHAAMVDHKGSPAALDYNHRYVRWVQAQAEKQWAEVMSSFTPKQSTSAAAKINKHDTVRVSEWFTKTLGRTPSIEDLQSLYGNRHKYRIVITDDDTYLTKDESFVPHEEGTEDSLEALFS